MPLGFSLFVLLFISLCYQLLPTDERHLFLLAPADYNTTSWQHFIWSIVMRGQFAYMVKVVQNRAKGMEKDILEVFFILMVGKVADHIVNNSTPYFNSTWFSYNTAIFGFFTGYLYRKHLVWKELD